MTEYELTALADCLSKLNSMSTGYGPGATEARVTSAHVQVGDETLVVMRTDDGDFELVPQLPKPAPVYRNQGTMGETIDKLDRMGTDLADLLEEGARGYTADWTDRALAAVARWRGIDPAIATKET